MMNGQILRKGIVITVLPLVLALAHASRLGVMTLHCPVPPGTGQCS